jgi:2-desacetyl-2-hydroxyethyl bacteriochlorophyllide A dehydrogenase
MKSVYVVFPEPDRVEVREETLTPPGPGEVLCEAQKSLISIGTETYCLRGLFDPGTNWGEWVQFPFRPGYSMAARVAAVGEGVTGLKEGDRVAGWIVHQQYFKAAPDQLYPIPEGVSDEAGTWNCLAVTTQLGVRRGAHTLGENVGVVGLGMLGQLVVQYLRLTGARRIIAIDAVQSRLDKARTHGATHTLALDVRQARHPIEEITNGRLLDAVYDITGHPAVLASCVPLVRKLGRVVLLGDTPNPTQQCLGPGVVSDSIAILGIHGSMTPQYASEFNPWTRRAVVSLFFDYLLQERMQVDDLISHRYSPQEAPEVYNQLRDNRAGFMGVIFDWTRLPGRDV